MPEQCKNPHCPLWVKKGSEWCDNHEPAEVTLEHLEGWLEGLETEYDRAIAKLDARDQIVTSQEYQRLEKEDPQNLEQMRRRAQFKEEQGDIKAEVREMTFEEVLHASPKVKMWIPPETEKFGYPPVRGKDGKHRPHWIVNSVAWPLHPGRENELPQPIAADIQNCLKMRGMLQQMQRELSGKIDPTSSTGMHAAEYQARLAKYSNPAKGVVVDERFYGND